MNMFENPDTSTSVLDRLFWDYFEPSTTHDYKLNIDFAQTENLHLYPYLPTAPITSNSNSLQYNLTYNPVNKTKLTYLRQVNNSQMTSGIIQDSDLPAEYNSTTYNDPLNPSFPDSPREQWPVLVVYGVLMLIGGAGNLVVLAALARGRRKSRVTLLMTHLAIADVCVTCGVIPLEIGWKYTNAWLAGNVACKMAVVVRAFGLYLSSNVLVCISLDRLFAVLYPLRHVSARRRNKQMLWVAWIAAGVCSLPQSVVFRVMRHPRVEGFEQCVSFTAFTSLRQEVAYNVFCVCAMYLFPLAVIAACYAAILHVVCRAGQLDGECPAPARPTVCRPSLARTRRRTLCMTVTIVTVFALCWLPYATMVLWYMIDRESASSVSPQVQDLLFAMAVSNSCMNPLVYGSFTLDLRVFIRRLLGRPCCGEAFSEEPGVDNINHNHDIVMKARVIRYTKGHRVRFAETAVRTARPA